MQRDLVGLTFALLAASCAEAQQAPWPSPDESPYSATAILGNKEFRAAAPVCRNLDAVATPDSIGGVSVGDSQEEIMQRCSGRALKIWDWGSEGIPEPALLQVYGTDLVLVVLEDTMSGAQAYRVVSADAKTQEGISAGSTFSELRTAYPTVTLLEGECQLWVVAQGLEGLSFLIDLNEASGIDCSDLPGIAALNQVDAVPGNSLVQLLNHYGR